jgi:hypothetical protein
VTLTGCPSRLSGQYISADGNWNHKFSLSEARFDNKDFKYSSAGLIVANGASESNKRNYQYIGSRLWTDSQQQISLLLEREEEEYKQFGGYASGNDANKFVGRDTDSIALEYRLDPTDRRHSWRLALDRITMMSLKMLTHGSLRAYIVWIESTRFRVLREPRSKIQPFLSFMVFTADF